jgi:transcriptional regulator with PAS, ATPase and Fis domain
LENLNDRHSDKIFKEWNKMIKGVKADPKIVKPEIISAWEKSFKLNIDPYRFDKSIILTSEELQNLLDIKDMEKDYGQIINIIKDIAIKMDLTFTIFDEKGRMKGILALPESITGSTKEENIIIKVASEDFIGSNAISMALKENKPIQLFGSEHYNYYLHGFNCSSAPIHDVHGKVIGAINISSNKTEQTVVELGLVESISKFLDSCLTVNYMINNLSFCSFSLMESIEYLPNGVIFNNKQTGRIDYNNKVLKMLKIETKDKISIADRINRYREYVDSLARGRDLVNEEVILNVKGKKKSFIITTKNILDSAGGQIGEMVSLQETDEIMKLQNMQRSNEALYRFDDILGEDCEINRIKDLGKKVSLYSSAVMLTGESGTGKEMFAQSIHNESQRNNKPFVAINCGAIPSELIESELFGYEPGAFTGALTGGKIGKFELASGGTLFLDEIESMPLDVQIKLLRALSTDTITRIGGLENIPFDIRIISATKKDLLKESDLGNFRDDLYFRLNIINLKLPPLRERTTDIPVMAEKFVEMFAKKFEIEKVTMSQKFIDALLQYYWRGNVRELKNVLERAVLLNGDGELTIDNLPEKIIKSYRFKTLKTELAAKFTDDGLNKKENLLKTGEVIIIEHVLEQEGFNMSKTAKRLGISRPTLYSKIEKNSKLKERVNKFNIGI